MTIILSHHLLIQKNKIAKSGNNLKLLIPEKSDVGNSFSQFSQLSRLE
jgi:hypothetical protein